MHKSSVSRITEPKIAGSSACVPKKESKSFNQAGLPNVYLTGATESFCKSCKLNSLRRSGLGAGAAINEGGRQVSPDNRARLDSVEMEFQVPSELHRFWQPSSVKISKRGKNPIGSERGENRIHHTILNTQRQGGPGQTADDVVGFLFAVQGEVILHSFCGVIINDQIWEAALETTRIQAIQFQCDECGFLADSFADQPGKRSGARPDLDYGIRFLEDEALNHGFGQGTRTRTKRTDAGWLSDESLKELDVLCQVEVEVAEEVHSAITVTVFPVPRPFPNDKGFIHQFALHFPGA